MADSQSREPRRGGMSGQPPGEIQTQDQQERQTQRTDAGGQGPPSTQRAKERIQEGTDHVKREAGEMGQQMQKAAEERAGRWTERASHQASSIAHALRIAGQDLDEQGEPRFAHWSESAADEVNKVAGYLKQEDPRSILRDVEGLARRNPGAFVGGTFAVGLLLGRFLRSSEPGSERTITEA